MSKTAPEANTEHPDAGGPTPEQAGAPVGSRVLTATEHRAMAKNSPAAPQPVSEVMAMMQMMERIAKNKEVDVAKMKVVEEMGTRLLADQRRAAFDDALAQMQAEMPTIGAKGRLEIRAKDAKGERTGRVLQSTPYAKWEDINDAIKPVLKKYGFVLRFKTGLSEKGLVAVTGILAGHGHREETTLELQHDATGSKNAVQAVGSSTAYGKRYAAAALLNLTSRGEDDDGKLGGGEPADGFPGDHIQMVSSDQITALVDKCKQMGCSRERFLQHADVATFEEIPASNFDKLMADLGTFRKAAK